MIYLDNAATTWPKPPTVRQAVNEAMQRYGANPGRGGHAMAMETAMRVYACRETVAQMFGLDDPSRVVFTANCTMALNLVIKGLLGNGGHAVISDMEHNSVVRPLEALAGRGVSYSKAAVYHGDPSRTVDSFRRAIRPSTRLILCMHASNVFGTVLPIRDIGRLALERQIPFAVDAAQSAGILPIHVEKDHIDYLCMPGHKGLYGPMGTGILLCRSRRTMDTLIEGGTGSSSLLLQQPEELPDRFESGTVNVPGICGLNAGIQWLQKQGTEMVAGHEMRLMQWMYDTLASNEQIVLYTPRPVLGQTVPLLSLNVIGSHSEEVAALLAQEGIAVRAGLHCAPSAHEHAQTLPDGTVRFAPSAFTDGKQVEATCKILMKILRKS